MECYFLETLTSMGNVPFLKKLVQHKYSVLPANHTLCCNTKLNQQNGNYF